MRKQARILAIVATDRTFERAELRSEEVWVGRCLHCNAPLTVSRRGELLGQATVEHIRPKAQGGTEALENLALACARCNHAKGVRHDARPTPRGLEVMEKLLERRRARWREPPPGDARED